MPVRFTIDHDKRYVTVRATGVVLLDEVLDYFDALVTQNAMPYRKLFDAREAQPQLSDDDVMVLGARVSAYAAYDPRGPVAGEERAMRGGSWMCAGNFCTNYRVSGRSHATADSGLNNLGFRCARDAKQ